MKQIKIEAYEYKELDQDAKFNVKYWLDEDPVECEEEDEQGNITYKYCYFSEMEEEDLQDHCESNNYLFNKYGKPIHHLINKKEKK
jgi:hypothetical protein